MKTLPTAAMALALAAPALAQESVTLQVHQSEEHREYLATAEGRPVYLFTTDTQGTGDQPAQISCTSQECLDAWPLVTGEPEAGQGVDASLLGTTAYEGQPVVTYIGWPLYSLLATRAPRSRTARTSRPSAAIGTWWPPRAGRSGTDAPRTSTGAERASRAAVLSPASSRDSERAPRDPRAGGSGGFARGDLRRPAVAGGRSAPGRPRKGLGGAPRRRLGANALG